MSFDLFRDDPNPPAGEGASSVIATVRRRRARQRGLVGGAAVVALIVVAVVVLLPNDERKRPVVADEADGAAACRLGNLDVSHLGAGSAMGSWGDRLLFRNVGRRACVLDGYPAVTGLGGVGVPAEQTQSGMIGYQTKDGTGPVTLEYGQMAEAVVEGTNVPPGDAPECSPAFSSLEIGVPDSPSTLALLGEWNNCARLEVHPFAPHAGSSKACPAPTGDPVVATIRKQTDGEPVLDASAALAQLQAPFLHGPVDAELVTNEDGLAWVFRNRFVALRSSMGESVCGEVKTSVNATTGQQGSVYETGAGGTAADATTTSTPAP